MKKILLIAVACGAMITSPLDAWWHGYRGRWYGGWRGAGPFVAGGVVGGLLAPRTVVVRDNADTVALSSAVRSLQDQVNSLVEASNKNSQAIQKIGTALDSLHEELQDMTNDAQDNDSSQKASSDIKKAVRASKRTAS